MNIITSDNFQEEIREHPGITVIDFWADWCGPCKMMAPVFEELSKELPKIKFAKLNVDDQGELAQEFGVMSIPTFIVFKNGKEVGRIIGARGKSDFKAEILKYK